MSETRMLEEKFDLHRPGVSEYNLTIENEESEYAPLVELTFSSMNDAKAWLWDFAASSSTLSQKMSMRPLSSIHDDSYIKYELRYEGDSYERGHEVEVVVAVISKHYFS